MIAGTVHGCLQEFPGAALEIREDGVIRASNGLLDVLVGRGLVGVDFSEVLDASSQEKWRHILSRAGRGNPACRWELVVNTPATLELKTFLALWSSADADPILWLLEYSVDPKLELLYGELSGLHGELVEAQRRLRRERDRLSNALAKAELAIRTRDDVLAFVSHDLRNPVGTIMMAAGLLDLPISEEKRAHQVEIIRRTAESMSRLISDLLDASAIESGGFALDREDLALGPVVSDVCQMFTPQTTQKGQRLKVRVADDLPRVQADRHRLQQVLSNLIGNAVKFTPEGGSIEVRAEAGVGSVIVSVSDSGPGIGEEDFAHIFDRYWHTSRRRRGGAGLGLAIAKGIVEAHGGEIAVESTPGQGARFHFSVPATDP